MLQHIKNLYHLLQSFIFNVIYRFPAKNLTVIGVSGTDGKTTTVSMIYHVLKKSGYKAAMISTIHAKIGDEVIDTGLHVTSPEPWDLPKILRLMINRGVQYVVSETTSSGLDQNRDFSVKYDASIITNIGHDHLDYHKTWENYANAKFKLFKKTKSDGLAVYNLDHKSAEWLKAKIEAHKSELPKIEGFALTELNNMKHSVEGIEFEYKNVKFKLTLIGEYNFSNTLGVIKICEKYLSLEQIAKALESFEAPLGRMQVMQTKPFTVIIDFAHTPSSLERALESVNKIKPNSDSKIITVFGCAGQRDPERRKMGAVSAKLADITLASLEDPRDENIAEINNMIVGHAEKEGGNVVRRFKSHKEYLDYIGERLQTDKLKTKDVFSFDYAEVQNRLDAISFAFKIAKPNDIVFITGKGHEQSLGIGEPVVEYPYTDQEAVKKLLD